MSLWNTILYQPLLNLLIVLYNFLGHSMGVAIIVLTLLVRLALVPLTKKQLQAQKKLKDLQPEMDKLKKDHGHDKQKLTKATMELYQKHGVNPLSSCLPLLIQLPVFIALYQVFFKLAQSAQLNMLYPFVQKPEAIATHFLWFDLAKADPLYILPILAGAAMFWQNKMMMPSASPQATSNNQQSTDKLESFQKAFSKQTIYLFPIMTIFIAARLPSALALYWFVTTAFGVAQQYWVLRGDGKGKANTTQGTRGTVVTVRKREEK